MVKKTMAEGEKRMKKGIHPEYVESTVKCACGEVFTIKSNKKETNVDTCSKCHPFYTGNQNTSNKRGAVDKFNKKYGFKKNEKAA